MWKSKIHKVNKSVIIQDYCKGGIKMVDYKKFITALKSTWIRRILQSNAKWKKLFESELKICTDKLWIFGIDFIKNVCAKSTNNFWKDVFQSWSNVYHSRCESSEILSEHVWYNPKITVGGNLVFLKSLFNSGIVFIYDLLDSNGNVYSFDYIQSDLKSKINFVEYVELKKAIQER